MSLAVLNSSTLRIFVKDVEAFQRCVDQSFRIVDVDGDGKLSHKEFREGLGKLFTLENDMQSCEEIDNLYDTIFERFDIDRNGSIDCIEFHSLMKEIMLAMARGFGSSPIGIILDEDSLLNKAIEHEIARASSTTI